MKLEYDPEEDEVVLPNKYERDDKNYEKTNVRQERTGFPYNNDIYADLEEEEDV